MRIARLDLAAFGPFTERSLDLSGGPPGGLHLVYGKNAAGKSSALRAISDLLFGIPPKSGDDHVHPYQSLRIRALIESANGERLLVQRLKRNKDSLRDEHDAPLDEIALKRLLGNVDRPMFERVFGLDHERLRDAGIALLEGGGDVGESLFDAGAGGQGVRRVLARLREEAERLFKPRGGKQEIVQLLESYKAARERVRNATHAPDAYAGQQQELEKHRVESERLWQELSELRRERERSRSLQAALKSIAKREKLLAEIGGLGKLPDLDPEFGARRERVQASLATHEANVARADREIARLNERRATLRPPGGLLAVGEEVVTALREAMGSTKKMLHDLPSRETLLAEHRATAQASERRLGVDPSRLTEEAQEARRSGEARFRKLLAERAAIGERRRAAGERLDQAELDCETQKARLASLPVPSNADAIERAVLFARQAGDVEELLSIVRRDRKKLELSARTELAALAPFDGSLADLCTLRVPAEETVLHFERSFADNDEKQRRAADGLSASRDRAAELTRELAAEERAGAVPSEEELARARSFRDEHFEELYKQWPEKAAKTGLSLFEAARLREYRAAVTAADTLADRLRREAARVAENARRTAELAQRAEEQGRFGELRATLAADRKRLELEWAANWAAAGLTPVRPAEMRGWLKRRQTAVSMVVEDATLADRESALARQADELRMRLCEALGQLAPGESLAVAVAHAQQKLDRERRLEAERTGLVARIAELQVRRDAARRELDASEREANEREAELRRVIGDLGFDATITPEEVEARLAALTDWMRARDQTRELERRVNGMKRDIAAFEAEVFALVAAHAPDLAELPAYRAATELVARFDRGRRDADALQALLMDLEERQSELEEERALLERAHTEAHALLVAADAPSLAELPGIEARTRKARELRAELDGVEATLGATAGARGFEALLEEAAATDPARLAARLEELDAQIIELEDRHADSIRRHQSVQQGLELFADTSAVEAAEEERALASALIARSDRWAKFKLAEVLLAREIERYREQNQGPVLRRATELFVRLTQNEYRGLRVGREERALVAVRSNDLEVGVEGLNEAARYHLYLALRLASLERHLEHAEPLPLVLDDVLIHFDEDGARAALGVLGDLAARTQVLLFTHHRHNVALAEAAVRTDALFVHEL